MKFKNCTIRFLCVSFLIFSPLFSACQKTEILKNVNIRANELEHYIDSTERTLVLKCHRKIYAVEIFNNDYHITKRPRKKDVFVALQDIPVGHYVVMVRLKDKAIVIRLLRNEPYDIYEPVIREEVVSVPDVNTYDKVDLKVENAELRAEEIIKKEAMRYWIVESKKGQIGYNKTKKFMDKDNVLKVIAKDILDQNTKYGKFKNITIWEIYDVKAFKKLKLIGEEFIKIDSPNIFNKNPYYITSSQKEESLIVKN